MEQNRKRHSIGLLWAAWGAWMLSAYLHPARARATTFQSPTPPSATPATVINQPYVTFQVSEATHKIFSFSQDIPSYWVILALMFLLVAITFYRFSGRPRH